MNEEEFNEYVKIFRSLNPDIRRMDGADWHLLTHALADAKFAGYLFYEYPYIEPVFEKVNQWIMRKKKINAVLNC